MHVSELAKEAGISPHVVRFYAETGLLRLGRNPSNGYKISDHFASWPFSRFETSYGNTIFGSGRISRFSLPV